jgi:uncharacterized phage protein (TIGR01671 family)
MREIKFRQWIKRHKAYHYVSIKDGKIIGFASASIIENPVMQYTGLKDKNGKEIYESDIIRWEWGYDNKMEPCGVVSFDTLYDGHTNTESGATGWIVDDCFLNEECYIVGNIHENPELISEASK